MGLGNLWGGKQWIHISSVKKTEEISTASRVQFGFTRQAKCRDNFFPPIENIYAFRIQGYTEKLLASYKILKLNYSIQIHSSQLHTFITTNLQLI